MKIVLFILCSVFIFQPIIADAQGLGVGYAQNNKNKSNNLKVTSSQKAAKLAKSRVGGKVLKVQKTQINGNPAYRVRVLKKDGNIVPVVVDAKTGRVKGK